MRRSVPFVTALLLAAVVRAEDPPAEAKPKPAVEPKELDGMSVLGNQEAPKALVIVPWKSSELGATLGIAPLLDDSRGPVDREVFLRSLSYYEIRSETTRHPGAPRSKS